MQYRENKKNWKSFVKVTSYSYKLPILKSSTLQLQLLKEISICFQLFCCKFSVLFIHCYFKYKNYI